MTPNARIPARRTLLVVGILTCVLMFPSVSIGATAHTVSLVATGREPKPVQHGLAKLREALRAKGAAIEEAASLQGMTGAQVLVAGLPSLPGPVAGLLADLRLPPPTRADSLLVRRCSQHGKSILLVAGADPRGLMYALLDVADRVAWAPSPERPFSEVRDAEETPYAPERALSLYTFNRAYWESRGHIYRGGVQGGGIPGADEATRKPTPGLVWGVTAENLLPYTKAALASFVRQVPALDGLQFRMHDESGLKPGEQEAFWRDVFQLMKQAAPNRQLDLRAKGLPDSVIQSALDIGVPFRITTKYWMEQMGLPFHPTHINPQNQFDRRHSYADLLRYPQRYPMHWRLWNGGTARVLLWGDPDYARRFVESTRLYDGAGFEVNEPLCTKLEAQPDDAKPFDLLTPDHRYYDYEFERYWHFFQVFGRLGYSPDTTPAVWGREFQKRFGGAAAPFVEKGLHAASRVLPRIVASCYPYSAFPMTRGWAEKQRLGDLPAYARAEGSDIQQFVNFDEEAQLLLEGGETAKIRPGANSRWFARMAAEINVSVAQAEAQIGAQRNREFDSTVTDLNMLANLCGHWKDELTALEQGFATLENRLRSLKTDPSTSPTPRFLPTAVVGDGVAPEVIHEPVLTGLVGQPITITAVARDPAGVKWLRLRHRSVNQHQDYRSLPMVRTGQTAQYRAVVPAEDVTPTWDLMYFIEAMDMDGNGCIYPDLNRQAPYLIIKPHRSAS